MTNDEITNVQNVLVAIALEVRHTLDLEGFIAEAHVAGFVGGAAEEDTDRIIRNAPRWATYATELLVWANGVLAGSLADGLSPDKAGKIVIGTLIDRRLRIARQQPGHCPNCGSTNLQRVDSGLAPDFDHCLNCGRDTEVS